MRYSRKTFCHCKMKCELVRSQIEFILTKERINHLGEGGLLKILQAGNSLDSKGPSWLALFTSIDGVKNAGILGNRMSALSLVMSPKLLCSMTQYGWLSAVSRSSFQATRGIALFWTERGEHC